MSRCEEWRVRGGAGRDGRSPKSNGQGPKPPAPGGPPVTSGGERGVWGRTPHLSRHSPGMTRHPLGFTLIEVMVACGIFFMATFAILALVSQTLRNARALQRMDVDAGMAAAQVFQMLKTNKEDEGSISGDFGDQYRDYSWEAVWEPYQTNGLLQVGVVVNRRGARQPVDILTFYVFDPNAQGFGMPAFR
jgi:hypothetical protein